MTGLTQHGLTLVRTAHGGTTTGVRPASVDAQQPGTLRDSLVLLSVVLEQETELEPTEIMTDTDAYTDAIFGIFWLVVARCAP